MHVVLILLAASLAIATGFLIAFIWSVKSGQFEDDYTPSVRMLFDDQKPMAEPAEPVIASEQDHKTIVERAAAPSALPRKSSTRPHVKIRTQ